MPQKQLEDHMEALHIGSKITKKKQHWKRTTSVREYTVPNLHMRPMCCMLRALDVIL